MPLLGRVSAIDRVCSTSATSSSTSGSTLSGAMSAARTWRLTSRRTWHAAPGAHRAPTPPARLRLCGSNVGGPYVALYFGADMPALPGRTPPLHRLQHVLSGYRHPPRISYGRAHHRDRIEGLRAHGVGARGATRR